MAAHKKTDINLLPREGFESTTTGRVLVWIVGTFRIIVIFTELIVVGAFVTRFFFDAQNADITDELNQKSEIIASTLSFENEFKNSQKQLEIYTEFTKDDINYSNFVSTLTSYIPPEVYLENIFINGSEINLTGKSSGELGIQQFLTNMENLDIFSEVSLGQIGYKENETYLTFNVKTTISKESQ